VGDRGSSSIHLRPLVTMITARRGLVSDEQPCNALNKRINHVKYRCRYSNSRCVDRRGVHGCTSSCSQWRCFIDFYYNGRVPLGLRNGVLFMTEIPIAKYRKIGLAMQRLIKILPDNIELVIRPNGDITFGLFIGDDNINECDITTDSPEVLGQRVVVASELYKLRG